MQPAAYTSLADVEVDGWYYEARRRAIRQLIQTHAPLRSGGLSLLDVGCGTGGTTAALAEFGDVTGLEPSAQARELLARRYPQLNVVAGTVQTMGTVLPAAHFDVITVLGVLYHREVDDPQQALKNLAALVKPGGVLIWNDATYDSLRRRHDELVHAARRFTPGGMCELATSAGLVVEQADGWLTWGAAVAWVLARAHQLSAKLSPASAPEATSHTDATSDDRPLPQWLNRLLCEVSYLEWQTLRRLPWTTPGVSCLLVARKPLEASGQGVKVAA